MALIHAAAFPPGERWGADALGIQLTLPGAYGFLDPAGGFVLARVAADEAEILTLAVMPDQQRQHIGTRLLAATMQEAQRRKAASFVLEVATGNHAARALYAQHGFIETGRRRDYYPSGQDALILRATL